MASIPVAGWGLVVPSIMEDGPGELAPGDGPWEQRCPVPHEHRCLVKLQGGRIGLLAHLAVVHGRGKAPD